MSFIGYVKSAQKESMENLHCGKKHWVRSQQDMHEHIATLAAFPIFFRFFRKMVNWKEGCRFSKHRYIKTFVIIQQHLSHLSIPSGMPPPFLFQPPKTDKNEAAKRVDAVSVILTNKTNLDYEFGSKKAPITGLNKTQKKMVLTECNVCKNNTPKNMFGL